jgi:hypothetical protein
MAKRGHNLPEAAKGKRFGDPGGPDPSKASKSGPPKWSIRNQVRYLAAQEIDPNDKAAIKISSVKDDGRTVDCAPRTPEGGRRRHAGGHIRHGKHRRQTSADERQRHAGGDSRLE